MKPKYVYHGSGIKIEGALVPRKANDLTGDPYGSLKGVYATHLRKWAMIMGILSCKGVKSSSTHVKGKRKIDAIIHSGWPKQDYFYLYTLSSKTFKEKPKGSAQWVSLKAVKPKKIEKLLVKNYIHWIKKPIRKKK